MNDSWTLKKKLVTTFAVILVVSGALVSFALASTYKLIDAVGWNTHT